MKNIVVTGATSMIGIALIEACLAENCMIIAFVREGSPNIKRLPKSENLQVVYCDVAHLRDFDASQLKRCDVFYHLAWSNTDKNGRCNIRLQQPNIGYTLDALELAKRLGCTKFVGAGSQAEYGIHMEKKTRPDSPVCPATAYGISKYSAGRLSSLLAEQFGMDFIWVRIFSVYGKNDSVETMVSSSLEKMQKGEHCSFTSGKQQWDYLYSSDAGKAFYLIGKKVTGNKTYCLGSGQSMPLRKYVEIMRDLINPKLELGFGEISNASENAMGMCADISALSQDTGWEPEIGFWDGVLQMLR